MAALISRHVIVMAAAVLLLASAARAQDPPPRIPLIALDLHGTLPFFPKNEELARSRNLVFPYELPGTGLGAHGALTLYPLKWKAVTFGVGIDAAVGRASRSAETYRPTTETFAHIAPEISFNFGNGNGWSYISGGLGPSVWSIAADGEPPLAANTERLKTINYGGGARWFIKPHLAFSLDVRFYAINPSTPDPVAGLPAGPRTRLLVMGAGISLK
jgi:hypothetical protein